MVANTKSIWYALKSWWDGQLNLVHGIEIKKYGKLKTKTE